MQTFNLKTTVTTFYFNISVPAEAEAYKTLCDKFAGLHIRCFDAYGRGSHYYPKFENGVSIELETKHIFNNQWNAAGGLRIFDFALDYLPNGNKNIKKGYYLDITPAMLAIREQTYACGYCGKQTRATPSKIFEEQFCPHCWDSQHLTKEALYLLRLQKISDRKDRPELSQEEQDILYPLFKQAQIYGNIERGQARITKLRTDLLTERDKTIDQAITEYSGFTWLLDAGINTDNCIYYKHITTFSFGWRTPIDKDLISELRSSLANFPYKFEIK
jgi:hypothetical protein